MVEQLHDFLGQQLGNLSQDHPDRSFLEKIQSQTESYIDHRQYASPKQKGGYLSKGRHIVESFQATKNGPYFEVEALIEALQDLSLTRWY